jgi:hypothetical protein
VFFLPWRNRRGVSPSRCAIPLLRPPARPPKEECRRIVSVASRASQCAFLHKQLTLLLLPSATIAGCSSILSTPMQQQQHKTKKKKKKEAELTKKKKKKKKGGNHKEDQQQEKATSAITSKSY